MFRPDFESDRRVIALSFVLRLASKGWSILKRSKIIDILPGIGSSKGRLSDKNFYFPQASKSGSKTVSSLSIGGECYVCGNWK
jgi:hypothetical protein